MRIGINASDQLARPDLGRIVTAAADAERDGFASFWLAQTALVDSTAALGLAGQQTSEIELGTAVVPTWERHPRALAAQALTAQAAAGGRFTLGIGLSHQPMVEGVLHMSWERPIRHINDYLDVLLPLLEEGKSTHRGEVWSFTGSGARPTDDAPTVMLAALGDQMLRIAGRRTAGTILWCVGPVTIERQILPAITTAAEQAGRQPPRVVCSLPVWVTDDLVPAKEFVGATFKDYAALPSYRAMLDVEGVQGIESISPIGSEDRVREQLGAIARSGATDFTAVVMGGNPDELARGRSVLESVAADGA